MKMRRLLISGFEGFGNRPVNPTEKLIQALPEIAKGLSAEIRGVVLPVTFEGAFARLRREIQSFSPDVVISFGLAGGRSASLEIERVAINCKDAEIPDNAGVRVSGQPLDPHGAPAYFTTLPISKLLTALATAGVPAKISNTAGTYVCNAVFYDLQQACSMSARVSGFIHVPDLPETVGGGVSAAQGGRETGAGVGPSMTFETLKLGVRTILQTLVNA